MKIKFFYHSLVSDWNHGNAHFLRGIAKELLEAGHEVKIFEPENNWSLKNMRLDAGERSVKAFRQFFPQLRPVFYDPANFSCEELIGDADLVLVHEWNSHGLVKKIGNYRKKTGSFMLLFHDTHHRAVTDKKAMAAYDLENYDGVLAFGKVIRDIYLQHGWSGKAWTWHEAADDTLFFPQQREKEGDLVWIGNWGDNERAAEIREFLIGPVRDLKLKAAVYGVRYPAGVIRQLEDAGIEYRGWLPNYRVPEVFSRFRITVHIPRGPYVETLPGIPTIRPFEALACAIPLISAPWKDVEGLFGAEDFLKVKNSDEMKKAITDLLQQPRLSEKITGNGLATIKQRHTCRHRVTELLGIYNQLIKQETGTPEKNQIINAV